MINCPDCNHPCQHIGGSVYQCEQCGREIDLDYPDCQIVIIYLPENKTPPYKAESC